MPNYSGQQNSSESKFEDIVQLLRSTGFSPNQIKRTQKYPESFFKRILIPEHFVRMVVGRLRSDDIYNQVRKYIKEKKIFFFLKFLNFFSKGGPFDINFVKKIFLDFSKVSKKNLKNDFPRTIQSQTETKSGFLVGLAPIM